ncbi:unnamed protein product [Psylliodes chrysocephalus]|uniref:chitinase n=1 Tax=Psylliodes chrysocephalus TaxID=3402493 RepID=A0A9P0CX17_9CUCU|nr:unnamed protein product [Psylliodes chrysocephala]
MKLQVLLGAVCVIFMFSMIPTSSSHNIACYFASWAVYRNLSGTFDVYNIDPHLCTHVYFAFVELNEDGSLLILDKWESNDENDGGHYHGFRNLANLRKVNPELKTLVSLGGWNAGSKNFSGVSADPVKRQRLVQDSMRLIEKYNFDGFDIDWEYPTLRDKAHPEDKENFVELLKDYSAALKPRGLLLSAALAGAVDKIDSAYFVEQVSEYLDLLNIMTYDYHGAFDDFVGHVAPLHASPLDYQHGRNSTYVAATAVDYWIYKNADPSKINMGLATYGRTFTLEDKTNNQLYAPVLGPGPAGPYSGLKGSLGYNEICEHYSGSDSVYYWDDDQKVPHRVVDDTWIGFEDERSIGYKVDFAVSKGLGGLMIWSLDTDDFLGTCGRRYPLVNAVKDRLKYWESQEKK